MRIPSYNLQLVWGPEVSSPPPQLSQAQLQAAVDAGRDAQGKLDDASRFLIAYEWQGIDDKCKSPEVKAAYERLARTWGFPTFSVGRSNPHDLGVG